MAARLLVQAKVGGEEACHERAQRGIAQKLVVRQRLPARGDLRVAEIRHRDWAVRGRDAALDVVVRVGREVATVEQCIGRLALTARGAQVEQRRGGALGRYEGKRGDVIALGALLRQVVVRLALGGAPALLGDALVRARREATEELGERCVGAKLRPVAAAWFLCRSQI